MQYELQSAVLTASNSLSLGIEETSMYAGKVQITDLPSKEVTATELASKLEAQEDVG